MSLIEIFDDRHRLDKRMTIGIERRHQSLRIDREIAGLALLASAQMDRPGLIGEAFEVEGDPHAKRRR
jgi:hypothetical protein